MAPGKNQSSSAQGGLFQKAGSGCLPLYCTITVSEPVGDSFLSSPDPKVSTGPVLKIRE